MKVRGRVKRAKQRKQLLGIVAAVSCILLWGCGTPPEFKHALQLKTQVYDQTLEAMTQYRLLKELSDERYRYWSRQVKTMALLNQALIWITSDPLPPNDMDEFKYLRLAELLLTNLNPASLESRIIDDVNALRLKGLSARKARDGRIVFKEGEGSVVALFIGLPGLIKKVRQQSEYESKELKRDFMRSDDSYDAYLDNVLYLRELNELVRIQVGMDEDGNASKAQNVTDSQR